MSKGMTIKDFCEASGIIIAEAVGERFVGKVLFEVNMREGGIASVNVTRSGPMRVAGDPTPSNGYVPINSNL